MNHVDKLLEKVRALAIDALEDEDGDYFESEVEIFVMGYMAAVRIEKAKQQKIKATKDRPTSR